jgi:hypothetical protein
MPSRIEGYLVRVPKCLASVTKFSDGTNVGAFQIAFLIKGQVARVWGELLNFGAKIKGLGRIAW